MTSLLPSFHIAIPRWLRLCFTLFTIDVQLVSDPAVSDRLQQFAHIFLALFSDCLRCKIRSYRRPNFSANFIDFRQLVRARSRLYRSRFLQPNTQYSFCSIFRDLQEDHSFAPLQIQDFSKFSSESFCNFQSFVQNFDVFHNFHRILDRFC